MSALEASDDFHLCDRVFGALADAPIDVNACGEFERVVRLVWDSSGLIGNGGLHYLFEGDYPGDPGFIYTVAAYKRIGAQAAYEALQTAFRHFPGGVLPLSIDERLKVFESVPKETWDGIERRFYDSGKETSVVWLVSFGSIAVSMSGCLRLKWPNYPTATNPAMTTEYQAEGNLRRFVALDAGRTRCFHVGHQRPGPSEHDRST